VKAETLVLALGNPLRGDDGVGAAVVAWLEKQPADEAVTLVDGGTPGLETALLLQDCRRAIIVDAAEMGLAPGGWRRFEPDEASLGEGDLRSTLHSAGLAEALTLGAALGILPDKMSIYGIQPEAIGWEPGLSAAVEAAVPAVAAAILNELHNDRKRNYAQGQDSDRG
jgi:hydrogenase maturation protease